jgi:hypothetical protein
MVSRSIRYPLRKARLNRARKASDGPAALLSTLGPLCFGCPNSPPLGPKRRPQPGLGWGRIPIAPLSEKGHDAQEFTNQYGRSNVLIRKSECPN